MQIIACLNHFISIGNVWNFCDFSHNVTTRITFFSINIIFIKPARNFYKTRMSSIGYLVCVR